MEMKQDNKRCPIFTDMQEGLLFSEYDLKFHKLVSRHWYNKYDKSIQDVFLIPEHHILQKSQWTKSCFCLHNDNFTLESEYLTLSESPQILPAKTNSPQLQFKF